MTIAQCEALETGKQVCWKIGSCEYQIATFIRMVDVTKFNMAESKLLKFKPEDFRDALLKGRKCREAMVRYVNDYGREEVTVISPRRLTEWFE